MWWQEVPGIYEVTRASTGVGLEGLEGASHRIPFRACACLTCDVNDEGCDWSGGARGAWLSNQVSSAQRPQGSHNERHDNAG